MRTRKKTKSNTRRHPISPRAHPIFVALLVCLVLLAAGAVPGAGPDDKKKRGPADDFLIFGTIFTEQGFAVQGAKIEVRRAGEKKVRGTARSDRRGEFGVRVPAGAEYEVTIAARGFSKAERKVDGKMGQRFDFVERLKRDGKDAAKPAAGEKQP